MRYTYLILAAMFLLCLAPMPIGYFSLVRLVAVISFGVMAYKSYAAKKEIFSWTFGILALLFQPFVKITLGRTIWNIIDVVVAIGRSIEAWLVPVTVLTSCKEAADGSKDIIFDVLHMLCPPFV